MKAPVPLIKRFFQINCKGEECLKLAELIREKAPAAEYMGIEIREDALRITMHGYKTDIKKAWEYIRRLVSSYRSSVTITRHGLRRIKVEYLVEKTGRTFPPILLVEILKYKGYKAILSDCKDEIITDAEPEVLEELVAKISDIINKIRFDIRGTVAKYYVVVASIILGLEPEQVIEKGVLHGHLYRDEEGKIRIKKEWRQALAEFLRQ